MSWATINTVTLTEMIRIALRGYKTICVLALAAVLAGAAFIALSPVSYQSTSLVLVRPVLSEAGTKAAIFQAHNYANQRTITYKELATTDLILEPVAEDLDLGISPRELAGKVTALAALDTTIIEIIVSWDDPEMAAAVSNRISEQMVAELSDRRASPAITLELSQVQEAVAATGPSSPRPALILGFSALAGLLAGFAVVLFRHSWRVSENTPAQADP